MNLRIEGEALRFRLDAEEFALLVAGQPLESQVSLGNGVRLQSAVVLGEMAQGGQVFSLSSQLNQGGLMIRLAVSPQACTDLAGRLPCKEGLSDWCDVGTGEPLAVSLDVDTKSRKA